MKALYEAGSSNEAPSRRPEEYGTNPDLAVPAGTTPDGLPVTVSFLGRPFSEGALLGYGYDFEQATRAIRLPKHAPPLQDARTAGR